MSLLTKHSKTELTIEDELFVQAYMRTLNCAEAWREIRPGKNDKNAALNGWKWMQKKNVQKRLHELAKEKMYRSNAKTDALIEELNKVAFMDPLEFMDINDDGEPVLNMKNMPPETRRLLRVEFGVGVTKDGQRVQTYKVNQQDKLEAIEKLLKLHALANNTTMEDNRTAIQVNVNIPIPGQNWKFGGNFISPDEDDTI